MWKSELELSIEGYVDSIGRQRPVTERPGSDSSGGVTFRPLRGAKARPSLKRWEAQAFFGGGVAVTIVGSYGVLGGIA